MYDQCLYVIISDSSKRREELRSQGDSEGKTIRAGKKAQTGAWESLDQVGSDTRRAVNLRVGDLVEVKQGFQGKCAARVPSNSTGARVQASPAFPKIHASSQYPSIELQIFGDSSIVTILHGPLSAQLSENYKHDIRKMV